MYIQESGRAGQDRRPALALLLKNSNDLKYTSNEMKNYCSNTNNIYVEKQFCSVIFQVVIGIQEVVHAVAFVLKYASVNNVTPN